MRLPPSPRRLLPTLVGILFAAVLTLIGSVAHAGVTVVLSEGAREATGRDADRVEADINAQVNKVLEDIASGKAKPADKDHAKEYREIAKALLASNQTVKVMCREEAAKNPDLKDQYEQSDPGTSGGGAATKGDFDEKGNPKPNGTTIIVVECGYLATHGWFGGFGTGGTDSVIKILGHELVHASKNTYVHGTEHDSDTDIYDEFGTWFAGLAGKAPGASLPPFTYAYPPKSTDGETKTNPDGSHTITYTRRGQKYQISVTADGHANHELVGPNGNQPYRKYRIFINKDGTRTEVETQVEGNKTTTTETTYHANGEKKEKTTITEIREPGSTTIKRKTRTTLYDDGGSKIGSSSSTGVEVYGQGQRYHQSLKTYQQGDTETRTRETRTLEGNTLTGTKLEQTKKDGTWTDTGKYELDSSGNWQQVPLEPKNDIKTEPEPDPEPVAQVPSAFGGGPFAIVNAGLHVPMQSGARPGFQWGADGGFFIGTQSPFAIGVGGSFDHSVAPPVDLGSGSWWCTDQLRLMGIARPGAVLAGGRVFAHGTVGAGYVAQANRLYTPDDVTRSSEHGAAVTVGVGALAPVWRSLVIGGEAGTDLQWFRSSGSSGSSGSTFGVHNFEVKANAGWMF